MNLILLLFTAKKFEEFPSLGCVPTWSLLAHILICSLWDFCASLPGFLLYPQVLSLKPEIRNKTRNSILWAKIWDIVTISGPKL
jgi:hypothetical protein